MAKPSPDSTLIPPASPLDHLIVNPGKRLLACTHCGAWQKYSVRLPQIYIVGLMQAWSDEHGSCAMRGGVN